MASSSSSSSSVAYPLKYDVFLNFRGIDIHRGFMSHLFAALRQEGLQTFFDDYDLQRGKEIAQSLPQAIKDSTVAVVVFSEDYASSTWYLDELVEIIKCHRSQGQIVLPVFYRVDPSHLRRQSHNVAAAFVKHERNPKNAQKIPRWRDALTTAAGLSGFDSKNFGNEHMLINEIVTDIWEKLKHVIKMTCDEHLVGMKSRIEKIQKAFTIDPMKIRILGIWGMCGAGKTTIAEVMYKMMSHQFQGWCFVYNVREQVERSGSTKKLQEKLISNVLRENTFGVGPLPWLKKRLRCKKVLIVLDDVKDCQQLEGLIGDPCCFGLGSVILVTSRNKQVFERRTDFIYEVELLNDDEALQLLLAFKQNYLGDDYESLSTSIVQYAQGNPLALKVLGSALIGKMEEWESALHQLSIVQNNDIEQVLQIIYDSLDRVHKRTGQHVEILNQEPEKKEEDKGKESKEEKKGEEGDDKQKKGGEQEESQDKKEKESETEGKRTEELTGENTVAELWTNGKMEEWESALHQLSIVQNNDIEQVLQIFCDSLDRVHKRTGQHVEILNQEPEKEEEDKGKESKEEKKGEAGDDKQKKGGEQEESQDKKEKESETEGKRTEELTGENTVVELRKNEIYYYQQTYADRSSCLQVFSDENPNACSVM